MGLRGIIVVVEVQYVAPVGNVVPFNGLCDLCPVAFLWLMCGVLRMISLKLVLWDFSSERRYAT